MPDDFEIAHAQQVHQADQYRALINSEILPRIRAHWWDKSGCTVPGCVGSEVLRMLDNSHHARLFNLAAYALSMLAEYDEGNTHYHIHPAGGIE